MISREDAIGIFAMYTTTDPRHFLPLHVSVMTSTIFPAYLKQKEFGSGH